MLIALLRVIAMGWREHALAINAQEVAKLGRQLYERIGKLAEHWTDVGSKLGRAVDAYNASVGTLETRVLVTARKFQEQLKAAPEGEELAAPALVETRPKALQAAELVAIGAMGRASDPAEAARKRAEEPDRDRERELEALGLCGGDAPRGARHCRCSCYP